MTKALKMERTEPIEFFPINLETIRTTCGYPNYDAMRQLWYTMFGKGGGFPEKTQFLEYEQAETFLARLSGPKPNKPEAVVQGALRLLERLRKGVAPGTSHDEAQVIHASKQVPSRVRRELRQRQATPAQEAQGRITAEEEVRLERMRQRDKEDVAARELSRREEANERERTQRLEATLTPWVSGLTWVLNSLEMVFLIGGLFIIAGVMGLIVGLFLAVLGIIVLLIVRLQGSAGGYAVFAWLVVCTIGGWLVEYPAMLDAIETSGRIVSEEGETYAGISTNAYAMLVTFLMSGSSFAGTFFRYQQTRG